MKNISKTIFVPLDGSKLAEGIIPRVEWLGKIHGYVEQFFVPAGFAQQDTTKAGPLMAVLEDRYVLEQCYCPSCATLLDTDLVERADPFA